MSKEETTKFNPEPSKVRFVYPESTGYQRIWANGFQIIQEPKGELTIRFFEEYKDKASSELARLSKEKKIAGVIEQHGRRPHAEDEMVIVREVKVEVVVPPYRFKEWAETFVKMIAVVEGRKQNVQ